MNIIAHLNDNLFNKALTIPELKSEFDLFTQLNEEVKLPIVEPVKHEIIIAPKYTDTESPMPDSPISDTERGEIIYPENKNSPNLSKIIGGTRNKIKKNKKTKRKKKYRNTKNKHKKYLHHSRKGIYKLN
jgi:hypothetical protein